MVYAHHIWIYACFDSIRALCLYRSVSSCSVFVPDCARYSRTLHTRTSNTTIAMIVYTTLNEEIRISAKKTDQTRLFGVRCVHTPRIMKGLITICWFYLIKFGFKTAERQKIGESRQSADDKSDKKNLTGDRLTENSHIIQCICVWVL